MSPLPGKQGTHVDSYLEGYTDDVAMALGSCIDTRYYRTQHASDESACCLVGL